MAAKKARVSKRRMTSFSGKTITIQVGNDSFVVHQNLIKSRSGLFRSMLDNDKGRDIATYKFAKDDHEVVQIYLNWVYKGTICYQGAERQGPSPVLGLLARSYMGNLFEDGDFQDAIIDQILELVLDDGCLPGPGDIQYVYNQQQEESKLRRFIVDLYASFALDGEFKKPTTGELLPSVFLTDVLTAIAEIQRGTRPEVIKSKNVIARCIYHNHGVNSRCYKAESG